MSDNLRSKVIRLAHQNPELRPHLLPLLAGYRVAGGVGYQTDYIGGGSYSISAPKEWLERLMAAFPRNFRPRALKPGESLYTKNEKVVRAAEKWFKDNGLPMGYDVRDRIGL